MAPEGGARAKDFYGNDAPGALTPRLRRGPTAPCASDPVTIPLHAPSADHAVTWEPHYPRSAKLVYPRGPKAAPLLLIVTGSLHSGDGDARVSTEPVRYDRARDAFQRVDAQSTGHNNNEEIRFVTDGSLMGSVIAAEPREHLPYGYWIVVSRASATGVYGFVGR